MLGHPVNILKEPHVPELVYLVVSDGLYFHLRKNIFHIIRRCCKSRDSASGEGDFGCGGKLVNHVRVPGTLALRQNLNQVILPVIIKMMDTVSIIPENPEIRSRRFQSGKTADCFIRIGIPCRIGIFWHTPDSLDRRILRNQIFHHIHIRPCRRHGNRYHLNPEIFRNPKMPVIAWNRAEEFYLIQPAPRRVSHDTMRIRAGNRIIHDVKRRISVNNDVVRIVFHHVTDENLCLMNTAQDAVIPTVRSIFAAQIRIGIQHIHHSHGEIQLFLAGLAAAHIKMQLQRLILAIFLPQLLLLGLQLFSAHFLVWFHGSSS